MKVYKAYWKPCTLDTGHYETYFGEINAFLIDRALGFFHTPAVLPRAFLTTRLRDLADMTEVKIAIEQYKEEAN